MLQSKYGFKLCIRQTVKTKIIVNEMGKSMFVLQSCAHKDRLIFVVSRKLINNT